MSAGSVESQPDHGPDEPAEGREAPQAGYPRRVAVASLVTLGLVAAAALLIYAVHALLIIFIGILVGVMIDGLVRLIMRALPVRRSIALAVVLVGLIGIVVAAGVLVMPRSLSQATTIFDRLPGSVRSLLARVAGADETQAAVAGKLGKDQLPDPAGAREAARVTAASGRRAGSVPAGAPRQPAQTNRPTDAEAAPSPTAGEGLREQLRAGSDIDQSGPAADAGEGDQHPIEALASDMGAFAKPILRSLTLGFSALGTFVVIAFLGLYLAIKPEEYVGGFVRIFRPGARLRVEELLRVVAHDLRRWMLGTGIAMLSAGVLTSVGLWLLGLPYALALGILAGFAEVIPNVGPIAAALPAMLLTLQDGGPTWWHVGLFYLALQTFQSYVIQPVSQRYMVDVPPALSLAALLLLGWLCGGLGLFAAVPLVVIAIVAMKILWLRDTLGERIELPT